MTTSSFEYHSPTTMEQATKLLAKYGETAKILAGGHSLIPLMKLRLAQPQILIDLGKIDSMTYIEDRNSALYIGAMTRYTTIETSPLVRDRVPVLAEASSTVGDPQIRNAGTIGGSLSHADPAADLPAVILALKAQITTSSISSHRTIQAEDFFVDMLTTSIEPTEILSEIAIPHLPPSTGSAYLKFANKASHYAVVGVAAVVTVGMDDKCKDIRIGITGAGPKAIRATETEGILMGSTLDDTVIQRAAQQSVNGIQFNEDLHASADFRAHLTTVYTERAIHTAISKVPLTVT